MLILLGQTFLLTVISRLRWYSALDQHIRHYRLILHGQEVSLYMRMDDLPVFYDIFLHEVYRPVLPAEKPAIIVDLGAHIGLASVYFALTYSPEQIISVEPDSENSILFHKNTSWFPCQLIKGAINDTDDPLYYHGDPLTYRGRTSEYDHSATKVAGICIKSLIQASGYSAIDLLKADMEGAERILFKQHLDWLSITKYIIMEVHQDELASDFMELLTQKDFSTVMKPFRKDYLIQASRAAHS